MSSKNACKTLNTFLKMYYSWSILSIIQVNYELAWIQNSSSRYHRKMVKMSDGYLCEWNDISKFHEGINIRKVSRRPITGRKIHLQLSIPMWKIDVKTLFSID